MATREEVAQAIYNYAVELVRRGYSAPQVESRLMAKGLERGAASIVVRNVFSWRANVIHKAARKNMLQGVLWCMGALLVTALTFSVTGEGEMFIIAWGAAVLGSMQFFRGFFQYAKSFV